MRAEVKLHSTSSTAHTKIREDADDVRRMMLILISEAISNSNAVIRREFGKLRFSVIDDTVGSGESSAALKSTPERDLTASWTRSQAHREFSIGILCHDRYCEEKSPMASGKLRSRLVEVAYG